MQTTSAPIHCSYSAKAVPMNGAPSSNADKAAFRRLQENVQVQYLQKIALRAENPSGPKCYLLWTNIYFLRKQFSAAIGAAHFPADGTAIDACAAAIFTFFMSYFAAKIRKI